MRPQASLAALTLAVALAGTGSARADSGPVPLRRIALGELGGWIELTATLDGRAGRWLLDTGASRNLVSPTLARQLGLEPAGTMRAETPLGAVQGGEVTLPPLVVGRFERREERALVIEPARLLGPAGEGIDGVLGAPWLAGQRAELNLRDWTAQFGGDDSAPCPEALAPVALTRHRSLPVITLATGERYVLDSGNPAGLIRIEAEPPEPATQGLILAGELRLTVLPEAVLGPQRRSDVPVLRLTQPALHRALGDAARGLAGTAFLDGARWALDLAHERLCVEGGPFATPGGFGLVPERAGIGLRVQQVLPGSPADRAGIRAGEVIAQWAGLPASRPLAELWLALQGREELVLGIGEPVRALTLKRAIFAPAAP